MKIQSGGFTRKVNLEILQHIDEENPIVAQETLACELKKGDTGNTLKNFIVSIFSNLCFKIKKSYNILYAPIFSSEEERKANLTKHFKKRLEHKVENISNNDESGGEGGSKRPSGISITQIGFTEDEINTIVQHILNNNTSGNLIKYLNRFKDRIHSITGGISMCASGYEQTLIILTNDRLSNEFIDELRLVYNLPDSYTLDNFKTYFSGVIANEPESTSHSVFRLVSKLMHQKKKIKGVVHKNFSRENFSRGTPDKSKPPSHSQIPECFKSMKTSDETHYKDISNFAEVGPFNKYIFKHFNRKYVAGVSGSSLYLNFLVFELLKDKYPKNKENYAKVICTSVLDYVPIWHSLEEILLTFSIEIEHDTENNPHLFPGFTRYTLDINPITYFKKLLLISGGTQDFIVDGASISIGGKRKTIKRKQKKRKTKKKRGGNEQEAKKIQKIVRGRQSRKKTIKRLSDNPFSGDHPENLLKTGSVITRENANISASKTKLGQDVRNAMTKRIRTKGEKVKQQLLNNFPQFKEEINNITNPERMLRQDSSEYYMTDTEKRARGLLGGRKKRKTRGKQSKRKTRGKQSKRKTRKR